MRVWFLAMVLLLGACAARGPAGESFDLVLEHGEVVDGTGAPRLRADVGVRGERVVAVGDLTGAPARHRIDVSGRVVTPGFIDLLGYSDLSLLVDNRADAKIRQGITTVLTGEGESVVPLDAGALEEWHDVLERFHLSIDWKTLDGYWARLRQARPSVRLATLVGAKSVRATVLGRRNVQPSADQLRRMQAEVEEAMEQGAFGVGSAIPYAVSRYARTDELVALAEAAGRHRGLLRHPRPRRRGWRAPGRRRGHRGWPSGPRPGRDLAPQDLGSPELGADARGGRANRPGARPGSGRLRRCLPLHRRGQSALRRPSGLGIGRRPGGDAGATP